MQGNKSSQISKYIPLIKVNYTWDRLDCQRLAVQTGASAVGSLCKQKKNETESIQKVVFIRPILNGGLFCTQIGT
jgi:hypothetical protein